MTEYKFPSTFESSRERFRSHLGEIQKRWPPACLDARSVFSGEDLTIDWISTPPLGNRERLLVVTAGEHGIEGYVGSTMLELIMGEIIPKLNPANTGLLLVHCINPWGMKHRRRVNCNNVDLNRNYLLDPEGFHQTGQNPGYERLFDILNPAAAVGRTALAKLRITAGVLKAALQMSSRKFTEAVLLGQYRFPKGIYFGGSRHEPETALMLQLYREAFTGYRQIVHLDLHTGFGPRDEMSIVNSVKEPRSPEVLSRTFQYPRLVRTNPEEFYAIQGDMIDAVYDLIHREFQPERFYATTFEFGTYGSSFPAMLRSLQTMILENQQFWNGVLTPDQARSIRRDFIELYAPADPAWLQKALQDTRHAVNGILKAEEYW